MITEKLRKAIANRAATDDEWDYGVQQSWKGYKHDEIHTDYEF